MDRRTTLEQPEPFTQPDTVQTPSTSIPKKRWRIWLLVLTLLAVSIYFLRSKNDDRKTAAVTSGAAGGGSRGSFVTPVVAAEATKGDIGVYFTGLGAVTPIYTVTVKSQIAGYLMQVLYKEGQIVQKGDPLVEIDPRPYQVMLENAQAGLARDQANLENAKVDLKRYQTLVPLRAVPEQQLATQNALVKADEGIVKADQAQIDTAKLDLIYCHITAPITGRVGLRLVDPGNYVTPTDATGLVVITQIEPISVIFTLAEDQLPAILEKMRGGARLNVEAYDRQMTTKIAQGWLETVDNQIDPTTGTVKLRATFDNRNGELFPNQFVNARLLVEDKRGATLIPTAAVQRNAQRTYVYLVKPDSTVTVRTITTYNCANCTLATIGTNGGDEQEVTSGLVPGDVVVMTGVDRLQEGTKVRVQMAGERIVTSGK